MGEQITVNGKPWQVVRLLGHGKGGYSYLVEDGERQAVLKQIHHEPCSYYQFGDKLQSELQDHRRLAVVGIPMPTLLEWDAAEERLLKQYIAGVTAAELVAAGLLLPCHRRQVEEMCRLLYPAGLNIDYYPTNFVLNGGRLYYVDYECNAYSEEWDFAHWGSRYWSRTEDFRRAFGG